MENKISIGWFHALFAVLILWSISNVFLGYTVRIWDCHPIVYSCVVFTSASLALLVFAGYGKLASETIRSVDTWGYGIALMLNYIVLLALLALVTSTEATLLQSVAIVVSLLSGWFFIGRSISRAQFIGACIILAGLILVCSDLAVENLGYVILLIISMGIIQTIRTYIAEFHRPHKYASAQVASVKDRARVVALVMFVVSTLFFISFLGFALLMYFIEGLYIPSVPVISDFLNPYTVIFGMVAGFLLIAPLRFFEFSATSKIKTENYLAVSAFAPAATWFWEYLSYPITGVDMRNLTQIDAFACVLITVGGLIIAYNKMKNVSPQEKWKEYLNYDAQNLSKVEDSREIVAETLEHYSGNISKSSKALDVPEDVINAIISDEDKVLSFKKDILSEVARNYRHNVASCDTLTGLLNRGSFINNVKSVIAQEGRFSILYLDLDKFKPVNDTYGHKVGDSILIGVAERLRKLLPKSSAITRMGGDEYCVMLLGADKLQTQKVAKKIREEIARPFNIRGVKNKIKIGASVGVAIFPEDGINVEKLISAADNGMYGVKHSKA